MEALNRNANRVMNSLIPLGANSSTAVNSSSGLIYTVLSIVIVVAIFVAIFYYFQDSIRDLANATMDTISGYFSTPIIDASGNVTSSSSPIPAPPPPLPSNPEPHPESHLP